MKRLICFLLLILLACPLGGCRGTSGEEEDRTDLDFTVVPPDRLPGELAQILEGKKEESFALTYSDGNYLYIAIGAGRQPTGGYSYAVRGVWLTGSTICIDTDLTGPSVSEQTPKAPSWPMVVVKLEYRSEPVVFM